MGPSNGSPSTEAGTRPGDRLLRAVVRDAARWLVPLTLLGVLGAGATLALPAVLGRAVDEVVRAARQGNEPWDAAGGSLILVAGLITFTAAEEALGQLVGGAGTAGSTGALRRRFVRHVLAAEPTRSPSTAEGDLVARLVSGTATTARVAVVVRGLAGAVIPPAGGVIALAVIDPWLAATFAVGMAVASGAVRAYLRDAGVVTAAYLEAQAAIAGRLVDALAGARTIAAARTVDREVARTLEPLAALRAQGVAAWSTMARLAFRGEPVVFVTQVAVIAVAGFGLAAGRLTPGEMLAASRYAAMAAGIGSTISKLAGLTQARAAAQRVDEVLSGPVVAHGDHRLPDGPGRLELVGVTAGPPDAPVLDGLDLDVPGGGVVALVGRSGAGKSLAAAIAGRLCDPTEGSVLLDGVPLDRLDRRALRRAVTYAFERPALLGGTVAETIGLGVDRPPPERVRLAARAAHADEFIGRLPGGYDAPLADTPMSGGEVQRIGLARALAHDARVLVLDDATSSLDTATEARIADTLMSRTSGRTRLVVTHRARTAARADLVAWLDGGRVRAIGPHRDLWSDPDYRAIFRPAPVSPPAPSAPAPTAAGSPVAGSSTPATVEDGRVAPGDGRAAEPPNVGAGPVASATTGAGSSLEST